MLLAQQQREHRLLIQTGIITACLAIPVAIMMIPPFGVLAGIVIAIIDVILSAVFGLPPSLLSCFVYDLVFAGILYAIILLGMKRTGSA